MLQDKDIASDVLDMTKHQSIEYTRAALECSNARIRDTMLQFAQECIQDHWSIYELAERNGWYLPAGPADQQEIQRITQHFQPTVQNMTRQPVTTM